MQVGIIGQNCMSPTVVGLAKCGEQSLVKTPPKQEPTPKKNAPKPQLPQTPPQEVVIGGVKESEVDAYLSAHGKPPREFARAYLNPTDENIAALMKKEREQLALVSFIAQRRTDLADVGQQEQSGNANPADLPAVISMRITVLVGPECVNCAGILKVANQVVAEFPSLDVRIGVLGQFDQKQFVLRTAQLGVTLPAGPFSIERARQLQIKALPSVLIGDMRYQKEMVLNEETSNSIDLVAKVVQFRRANEKSSQQVQMARPEGNTK